ncbi:autophagy-related protein 22-like protein [Mortierella sp. GBAus27b]|nr:autophagy-related protein 22-like protein [Mortierella sp. GBAus27b]
MRLSFSPVPDEPPTTAKEIWAWYCYAFASEAYVVVALTSFIPITLETLASEEGHLFGTNEPCNGRSNATETSATADKPRYMISFGPLEMDPASFVMYLTSLAVLLQALTVVSISSMADYGSYRKKQLIFISAVGATATMLIGAVPFVGLAGALSVVANVSFGAGIVCFNAYLPVLIPRTTTMEPTDMDGVNVAQGAEAAHAALLGDQDQPRTHEHNLSPEDLDQKKKVYTEMSDQLNKDKDSLMGHISAKGFASGYFGGILLLLVCLYISYRDKSSIRSLKIGIFLSGLWWFIFAALAGVWLKRRPGRELHMDERSQNRGTLWTASQYVLHSWKRVGATIAQERKLPSAFAFLVAWFFLSDGYTSISNVALLFAKTSLHLPQTQLILLSLEVPICALIGTLAFPRVQRVLGYDQKQMVLLLLIMLVMVPLYGTLGLIFPFWPHLTSAGELFTLAAYFGLLIGAVQRNGYHFVRSHLFLFCRSMFAGLVPRGRESEFFGLYAITDKGSSWLGPLAVAAITDATHEIRHAFVFLLVLLSLPIPIIYFGVDMNQGRLDAERASQELQNQISGEEQDPGQEERERLLPPA